MCNKSDFKVFVSDEIFDFRSLEGNQNKSSKLTRACSHNAIDISQKKKHIVLNDRRISNTEEKLTKILYNSSPYNGSFKFKKLKKSRTKTIDPRFCRSRSPCQNNLSLSNSSYFALKSSSKVNCHNLNQSQSTASLEIDFKDAIKELEGRKFDSKSCINLLPLEEESMFSESRNQSISNHATPKEYVDSSYVPGSEEHFSCSAGEHKRKLRISEENENSKESAPLIKNCATVPLLYSKSSCIPDGVALCSKCKLALLCGEKINTCKCSTFECKDSKFCNEKDILDEEQSSSFIVPYVVMGSACGLLLIASIIWFVIQKDPNFFKMFTRQPTPPNPSVICLIKFLGASIKNAWNQAVTFLHHLLVIPMNRFQISSIFKENNFIKFRTPKLEWER